MNPNDPADPAYVPDPHIGAVPIPPPAADDPAPSDFVRCLPSACCPHTPRCDGHKDDIDAPGSLGAADVPDAAVAPDTAGVGPSTRDQMWQSYVGSRAGRFVGNVIRRLRSYVSLSGEMKCELQLREAINSMGCEANLLENVLAESRRLHPVTPTPATQDLRRYVVVLRHAEDDLPIYVADTYRLAEQYARGVMPDTGKRLGDMLRIDCTTPNSVWVYTYQCGVPMKVTLVKEFDADPPLVSVGQGDFAGVPDYAQAYVGVDHAVPGGDVTVFCARGGDLPGIMQSIVNERRRQDERWGGAEHDDRHGVHTWTKILHEQVHDLEGRDPVVAAYSCFLRIAAVAVAAMESCYRHTRRAQTGGAQ